MQNTTSTLPCTPQVIVRAVTAMFAGSDLHAKQIESVAHAMLGAMATPSAGVASLGRAASAIRAKHAKHGIKQVDRMLSNDKIDDLDLARAHVAFVVGQRNSIVVTMDWTEYGLHGQNRLAINLNTQKSRTHSLFRQGREYLRILLVAANRDALLLRAFQSLLRRQPLTRVTFGQI
jgi:hypothetical protein